MNFVAAILLKPLVLIGLLLLIRPITRLIYRNMKPGLLRRILFVSWK